MAEGDGEGEGLRERSTVSVRGVLIGFGAIVASVLIAVLAARALLWASGGVPASDGASPSGLSAFGASAAEASAAGVSASGVSAPGMRAPGAVPAPAPRRPFARASGPLLEVTPRRELQRYRAEQRRKLEGYHLVDEKAGIVQIPIERAMALVAEEHATASQEGSR